MLGVRYRFGWFWLFGACFEFGVFVLFWVHCGFGCFVLFGVSFVVLVFPVVFGALFVVWCFPWFWCFRGFWVFSLHFACVDVLVVVLLFCVALLLTWLFTVCLVNCVF